MPTNNSSKYTSPSVTEWLFQDFDKLFKSFNVDQIFHHEFLGKSSFEKGDDGSTITHFVPGHNSSTLDIEVIDDKLIISSITDKLPKNATPFTKKYKFDTNQYDGDNISAECKDGLLTITFPFKKKSNIKSNKIIIK